MGILWYQSVRSILLHHRLVAKNSNASAMLGTEVWFENVTAYRRLQTSKNLASLGLSRLGWVNITAALLSLSALHTLPEMSSLLSLSGISSLNLCTDGRYVGIHDDPAIMLILWLIFRRGSSCLAISLWNVVENSATGLNWCSSSTALTASSSARARIEFAAVDKSDFWSDALFPRHIHHEILSIPGGWIVTVAVPAEMVVQTSWSTGFSENHLAAREVYQREHSGFLIVSTVKLYFTGLVNSSLEPFDRYDKSLACNFNYW